GAGVGGGVGAGVVGVRAVVVVGFGLTVVVVTRSVVVGAALPDLAVVVVALPAVVEFGAIVVEDSCEPSTVASTVVSGAPIAVSGAPTSVVAVSWGATVSVPTVSDVEARLIGPASGSGAELQAAERTARVPTRSVVLRMSEGMAQPFLSGSARIFATDPGRCDAGRPGEAGGTGIGEWRTTPSLRSWRPPSRSRCNIVL
ncbi:MAG: hypothetical protein ABMA25_14975, partial [Ilumatobacteraceae bacterium]